VLIAIAGVRAAGGGAWQTARDPMLSLLQELPGSLAMSWPGDRAYQLLLALAALWMGLVLSARTDAADSDARAHGWAYRWELVVAVIALCGFLLPAKIEQPFAAVRVGARLFPLAALCGVLLPHGAIAGRKRLVLIPIVALAFAYPILLGGSWHELDQRTIGATRLLPMLRRGTSTLTLVFGDGKDSAADSAPLLQMHAYPQLQAGGFDPYGPTDGIARLRDGAALPAPPLAHAAELELGMVSAYDYVLTYHEPLERSIFGPNAVADFPMLGADSLWRLYEVHHQ
jgi:hypothetical protein